MSLLIALLVVTGCQAAGEPLVGSNQPPNITLQEPLLDPTAGPLEVPAEAGLQVAVAVSDPNDAPADLQIDWLALPTEPAGERQELGTTVPDATGWSEFRVVGLLGGRWTVTAWVTDSQGAQASVSLDLQVLSANQPPSVEIAQPGAGQIFTAGAPVPFVATVADDRGLDGVTAEWRSNIDDVFDTTPPSASGLLNVTATELSVGTHTVEVRVWDSDGLSASDEVVVQVVSANAPPSLPVVELLPDPATTLDDLDCAITTEAVDPEGANVAYSYSWSRDGNPTAWNMPQLPSDQTSRGETWSCTVVATDGQDDTQAVTAFRPVDNTPPLFTSASIGPLPVREDSVLSCTGGGWFDPDGDYEGFELQWRVDGYDVPANADGTLDGASFDRGQGVTCELTPFDGFDDGSPMLAPMQLVENSPPADPEVFTSPSLVASTRQELSCWTLGATDADGDSVTISYAWDRDGTPQPAWDSATVVPASATRIGETWTCSVQADDGIGVSAWISLDIGVRAVPGDIVISEIMATPVTVADAAGE